MDEWPISSGRYNKDKVPVSYTQPKSTEERKKIVQDFIGNMNLQMPVLLDVVEKGDQFEQHFAPWPLRFYVIKKSVESNGKRELVYLPSPRNCTYDLAELKNFLQKM